MKFKKNLLLFLISLIILSCKNDDDNDAMIIEPEVEVENLISNQFLIDEVWSIESITASVSLDETGDGNDSTNTLSQNENCLLDDSLVFSMVNNQLNMILSDNTTVCENFVIKYGVEDEAEFFITSQTDDEDRITSLSIDGMITWPGLFCNCDTLSNIEGETNVDGNKTLTGSINTIRGGRNVIYTYVLSN